MLPFLITSISLKRQCSTAKYGKPVAQFDTRTWFYSRRWNPGICGIFIDRYCRRRLNRNWHWWPSLGWILLSLTDNLRVDWIDRKWTWGHFRWFIDWLYFSNGLVFNFRLGFYNGRKEPLLDRHQLFSVNWFTDNLRIPQATQYLKFCLWKYSIFWTLTALAVTKKVSD